MRLSASQLTALRNLAHKRDGQAVDWISIADARALTELGFADRGRAGWTISPSGLAALASEPGEDESGADSADHSVVRFGAPGGDGADKPDDGLA